MKSIYKLSIAKVSKQATLFFNHEHVLDKKADLDHIPALIKCKQNLVNIPKL